MKAILTQIDQSLTWSDVPYPKNKDNEVIIKIAYAGVNRADLLQRAGKYPPPPGCPEWMGLEVSGTIVEIGKDVTKRVVGEKVCALLGGGGYAEYVAVREDMCVPIPKDISLLEASVLPEAFCTAYLNLFIEGGLKKGDVFLMQAGASGLASVVIPMAKAFGATVLTTIIDESKREIVKKTGVDRIINTNDEVLADVLHEYKEKGTPVNLVIDCIGGTTVEQCLPELAYMGKWIMIATLAGNMTQVNLQTLYKTNVRLIGSTLRSKPEEYKGYILSNLAKDIWPKVTSGEIRPNICAVYSILEADKAHELLQNGKSTGKVVLVVDESQG